LLVNVWRIASVHVTIFFALFSCFEQSVTEPAEFAYVHDFPFFPELIYHCRPLREIEIWLKIGFTSKY